MGGGQRQGTAHAHGGTVMSVAFSPDGQRIASGVMIARPSPACGLALSLPPVKEYKLVSTPLVLTLNLPCLAEHQNERPSIEPELQPTVAPALAIALR